MSDPRSGQQELLTRAYQAWRTQDWRQAGRLLREVVDQAPDDEDTAALWFDAALAYKFLRDWPTAYALGLQAVARVPRGRQEAAFWNLGIAATVLREWRAARDAWAGYGIDIPPGDDEIVDDFGVACMRITTRNGAEVVWGRRICPTRARVLSVPFDPARRYGEVIVHDGAPNGERVNDGRTYPVFDEIELFAPSELGTFTVQVATTSADDIQALLVDFDGHGYGAEPLASGNTLCACCSERTQPAARGGLAGGNQRLLLAAPPEQAEAALERWRAASPTTRYWEGLHPAT